MSGLQEILLANLPDMAVHQAFLGSLISGVFGMLDAKKRDKAAREAAKVPQITRNTVDALAMRKEAERGGFNPVTFMNAGGIAGFTTSETTGHNAMAAVPTAPGLGSVIAGAFQQTVDRLSSFASMPQVGRSSMKAASPMAGASLLAHQIGGVSTSGNPGAFKKPMGGRNSFDVPTVKTAGALTVGTDVLGQPAVPEVGKVEVTNPHMDYGVDPTRRNAANFEDRYGDSEVLSFVNGVNTVWDDFFYNVTGQTRKERGDRTRAQWNRAGMPKVQWGHVGKSDKAFPQSRPENPTVWSMPGVTIKRLSPAPQPQSGGSGGW